MQDRRSVRGALARGTPVEVVVEDGFDRAVGAGADVDGAFGGGLQTLGAVGTASRTMPRQARKPCSGCGRASRISSHSDAVAGPIRRDVGADALDRPAGIAPMAGRRDPSGRLIGKPKLEAALAALKRGLKEDADPLYDTWKRPNPLAAEAVSGAIAHRKETAVESPISAPSPVPPVIQYEQPAPSSPPSLRPSTGDTVPVWVIRYRVFPRWVWVTVGAALLFVISATLIRWLAPGTSSATSAAAPGQPVEVLESAQVAPLESAAAAPGGIVVNQKPAATVIPPRRLRLPPLPRS